MKRNIKFFTIVISLLLLSSIILTGCMYAIAADNGEMKPHDLNGQKQNSDSSGGNIVEDAPLAQTELQKKFNQYLHKDGNTVTIFSEEQYAELKAIRDNDNRTPLTYEEILFLVNDSINLYFSYDEIILPNANRDYVIPLLTNQSGNARVIKTGYKDASAYDTYNEAQIAYNEMLANIYEIIYYRIYMHDAGFESVFHHYHSGKDLIFGRRYETSPISSAVPVGHYQMLAIDGATFSGIDNEEKLVGEYKTLLEWKRMYEADAIIDYEHYPYLNSAVLCTSILNTVRRPMEYKFYIAGPKNDPAQQIYPTAELENLMPHKEFFYEAKVEYGSYKPVFSLDYETGKFAMSADAVMSFAIIGKFSESDGVLKMYPSNAGDEGSYSYVLHEKNGSWVYSAKDSKPIELAGFDWHKDIVFEIVHEGVSTNPNINTDPPINNEKDPPANNNDKNVYEMHYFKLDIYGTSCSLISSDGNVSIDGTFIQEGDAYILSFDGDYQYVLYYNEGVGYEYAKGESNPISGYEFEDGTWFAFNEGILTQKVD